MPHRIVCMAILAAWSYSTFALFNRDILPRLLIGPPPDLLSVARANADSGTSRWSILVSDDPDGVNLRSVGQVETQVRRARDGWVSLRSDAWFDSEEMLKGTPLSDSLRERVELDAAFDIDYRGNLESFRASVSFAGLGADALVLTGTVRNNELEVKALGLANWSKSFPYEPREIVQSPLAPVDRMPNLQVGQRWKSRIVSPITGQVSQVETTVERRRLISWDGNPVTTFEVVSRFGLLSARTWVRADDGLVLRQEAPLPLVRIVLERLPERFIGPSEPSEVLEP